MLLWNSRILSVLTKFFENWVRIRIWLAKTWIQISIATTLWIKKLNSPLNSNSSNMCLSKSGKTLHINLTYVDSIQSLWNQTEGRLPSVPKLPLPVWKYCHLFGQPSILLICKWKKNLFNMNFSCYSLHWLSSAAFLHLTLNVSNHNTFLLVGTHLVGSYKEKNRKK